MMARVKVRMYATVREAAGISEVEFDALDLAQVAKWLGDRFGSPMARMLRGFPDDHERLVVLVNGRNVRGPSARQMRFKDGDEISLFPPVSGG
jgi:MoaD family protein